MKTKKKIKIDFEKEMEYLGVQELTPELDLEINSMIEKADKEVLDARVNMRWPKMQLNLAKKAAELVGIPYQIYIRDRIFRCAMEDIEQYNKIKI